MQHYRDSDNDSNITAFEIGDDFIVVQFESGKYNFYKYTYFSAGSNDIEEMKRLANCGDGLNSFISKYKPGFESKW